MCIQIGILFMLAVIVALVCSDCSVGLGIRQPVEFEMYVLHAKQGPVDEPVIMTLMFSYQVSPVVNEELTYSYFIGSLSNCTFEISNELKSKKAFQISMSSVVPVTEMYGNVTIFGIRWMNSE
ncbi:uncharacterized protein LOC131432002 [Malaya genurostris]|uniref:uncharacterized protein LOC131432002 n=1 Tax=Malaya genurostris TaxID=325434 RepID=UPI0026F3ECBB|nr:uncharacterized protein LOC131432002 [Malaya genurostris]